MVRGADGAQGPSEEPSQGGGQRGGGQGQAVQLCAGAFPEGPVDQRALPLEGLLLSRLCRGGGGGEKGGQEEVRLKREAVGQAERVLTLVCKSKVCKTVFGIIVSLVYLAYSRISTRVIAPLYHFLNMLETLLRFGLLHKIVRHLLGVVLLQTKQLCFFFAFKSWPSGVSLSRSL